MTDYLKLADEAEEIGKKHRGSEKQLYFSLASALRELHEENEKLGAAETNWKAVGKEFALRCEELEAELERKDEALRHYKAANTWKLSNDETTYTYEGNYLHPSTVASIALSPTTAQPMEEKE